MADPPILVAEKDKMAEQVKEKEKETANQDAHKKCAFSGVTIKRVRRYYRNGKYFKNKNAYKDYLEKQAEEAAKAAPTAAPVPAAPTPAAPSA